MPTHIQYRVDDGQIVAKVSGRRDGGSTPLPEGIAAMVVADDLDILRYKVNPETKELEELPAEKVPLLWQLIKVLIENGTISEEDLEVVSVENVKEGLRRVGVTEIGRPRR